MSQGFAKEARIGMDLHVADTLYYTVGGSPGTTFVKADYPGLYGVRVKVQAAGGGGGGATDGTGAGEAGAGGGGGYAEAIIIDSSLAASETVTVGSGGAGGAAGNNNGVAGGSSSFGTLAVATGGGLGAGSSGSSGSIQSTGGDGGVGTVGNLLLSGSAGVHGVVRSALMSFQNSSGGSHMGGEVKTLHSFSASGTVGGEYGAGGSGGRTNTVTDQGGGAGANGIVIVEVLYGRTIAVDEDVHTQYLNDARHTSFHEGCKIFLNTNYSMANVTITAIPFTTATTTELWDDDGWHEGVTNPSRITVPAAGIYMVVGLISYDTNVTGLRQLRIRVNGTDIDNILNEDAGSNVHSINGTSLLKLAANDYIELMGYQSSGGALNVLGQSGQYRTHFAVTRIS